MPAHKSRAPRRIQARIQLRPILAVLVAASICVATTLGASTVAYAADTADIHTIRVDEPIGLGAKATVELTFDRPVTISEAEEVRRLFGASQPARFHSSVTDVQSVDRLLCNQHLDRTDDNGFLTLQYQCFPRYSVTNWGFRIAPDKQGTVVGGVTERGWTWFRNGERQSLGAPHRVPPDYLFHGTMKPMHDGDILDYQNYFTWRHNIGSGGTASLTIAGSLRVG